MEFQKGDRVVCINRKQSNILVVGKIYTVKYSKFDGGVLHFEEDERGFNGLLFISCLLYTSPSPRDRQKSRMPSSA